eukprot:GAHX01003021.1.p3 GENE.GAHX01003021.1~~GAHX01003021.1.p3  ORF type:complete len:76 (+),score=16.58 GAHX01003021.1:158-385(+)
MRISLSHLAPSRTCEQEGIKDIDRVERKQLRMKRNFDKRGTVQESPIKYGTVSELKTLMANIEDQREWWALEELL